MVVMGGSGFISWVSQMDLYSMVAHSIHAQGSKFLVNECGLHFVFCQVILKCRNLFKDSSPISQSLEEHVQESINKSKQKQALCSPKQLNKKKRRPLT